MRVTEVPTGGSALSYDAILEAARCSEASEAPAQTPTAQETNKSSQDEEKPPISSDGLGAAVLNGCVGNFYRSVEGVANTLTDLEFTLPQIVVIGQESSGKSSVLESLAMLPLFPRDSDICTRLPILLKMRHMSHGNVEVEGDPELMPHCPRGDVVKTEQQIKMRLIYSDEREPVESERNFTPEEATQLMRKWMEQIVKEEHDDEKLKGVVDHVLEIEIRSPNLPNLNLVDLPGIVAGKLIDEPDDMMQQTRALVEKYLQMPDTLVLAVVPAFERVRNSQAFQLVQQYNLTDKTIGVLTMVDRAVDETNPKGPLAEVMSRLDGMSQDLVYLKQGYVAVKNRDSRVAPERLLEQFKDEEKAWLEENLPGYVDRGLASSTSLVMKVEKMLVDHICKTWVPQTLSKIDSKRKKTEKKLECYGPDAQNMVNDFLGVSPTSARKRMLQLIKPILPEILSKVDVEILRLVTLIHADFLQSREEHELMLAPFQAKNGNGCRASNGSLLAASMVILDSHETYLHDHLVQILKNVVLHLVKLFQKTIATSAELEPKGTTPKHLERFVNLHNFFAGMLWERLNELLIDEEELLDSLVKSFLELDPENTSQLQIPAQVETSPETADGLKTLANELELYLDSKGFQNASLDELYLPLKASLENVSLNRDMSRLIISSQVPMLEKSTPQGFGNVKSTGFSFGDSFSSGCNVPAVGRGFSSGCSVPTYGFGFSKDCNPSVSQQDCKKKFQEVGEFEARLFYSITSHVVAPLLQSICNVSDLARNMQEYVTRCPKVSASKTHIFHESTSDKRRKLTKLTKRLDAATASLKSSFQ